LDKEVDGVRKEKEEEISKGRKGAHEKVLCDYKRLPYLSYLPIRYRNKGKKNILMVAQGI